jgi:hypothetical protein
LLDAIQHDGLFVGRRRRLSKEGGIVRVGNPFLATAMAVASIQEFTDVYRSLRTYTGVYGRIQEFTDVYRSLRTVASCLRTVASIQEFTGRDR